MEMIVTIGRTINLEKTARYGKFSAEYFENATICLIHPNDMKKLGIKEGNVKLISKAGSVVLRAMRNEFETSEGVIVIPNSPWANRIIDQNAFTENQIWFTVTIETTKEEILTMEQILAEIKGAE